MSTRGLIERAKSTLEPIARVSILWDIFQFALGGNREKRRLLRQLALKPAKTLEIGCATGNIADFFPSGTYLGIDIDANSIATARQKYGERGYEFQVGDVTVLPLPKRSFDLVLISHTAHHLNDADFQAILRRSHELLRRGGTLVILDMIRPAPGESAIKTFFKRLDRGEYIRNLAEFRQQLDQVPFFTDVRIQAKRCRKLGLIDVIDSCVITASSSG